MRKVAFENGHFFVDAEPLTVASTNIKVDYLPCQTPRHLVPCYFDAILTGVEEMVLEEIWSRMGHFVADNSAFVKTVALGKTLIYVVAIISGVASKCTRTCKHIRMHTHIYRHLFTKTHTYKTCAHINTQICTHDHAHEQPPEHTHTSLISR